MIGHWLADQVAVLGELSERCRLLNKRHPIQGGVSSENEANARTAFLSKLRSVVEHVNQRHGVLGCFVAHEGLLVEAAGDTVDFEALAAMSQWCEVPAQRAAETLSLGSVQQILIIGSERKLALIQLGQMTMGILSPASVQLSEVLST